MIAGQNSRADLRVDRAVRDCFRQCERIIGSRGAAPRLHNHATDAKGQGPLVVIPDFERVGGTCHVRAEGTQHIAFAKSNARAGIIAGEWIAQRARAWIGGFPHDRHSSGGTRNVAEVARDDHGVGSRFGDQDPLRQGHCLAWADRGDWTARHRTEHVVQDRYIRDRDAAFVPNLVGIEDGSPL